MSRKELRSDSSSSDLLGKPVSPIPSSVDAMPKKGKGKGALAKAAEATESNDKAETSSSVTNGSADVSASSSTAKTSTGRPENRSMPSRARSASLQKGVAVLRALARAPEDEVDSGYEDEPRAGSGLMPTPRNGKFPESSTGPSSSTDENTHKSLTDKEKQSGRENREGMRRRHEDKEVAKVVGGRAVKGNASDGGSGGSFSSRKEKRKAKSWEIPRKLFHSSIGFLVLYLYLSFTNLANIVRGLSVFLCIVITADVIRLNIPAFEWLYEKVLGFLMRESEKEKVNGVVWYLVGVLFCLHFMPEDIACVSIMILSWADTAASVFGRLFGQYTPPLPSPPFAKRKSLAGTIAAASVATLTATAFWATPVAQIGRRQTLATEGRGAIPLPLLCVGSGLVGGVAEALELGGVDDNLSLPILSALGIKGVVVLWEFFSKS